MGGVDLSHFTNNLRSLSSLMRSLLLVVGIVFHLVVVVGLLLGILGIVLLFVVVVVGRLLLSILVHLGRLGVRRHADGGTRRSDRLEDAVVGALKADGEHLGGDALVGVKRVLHVDGIGKGLLAVGAEELFQECLGALGVAREPRGIGRLLLNVEAECFCLAAHDAHGSDRRARGGNVVRVAGDESIGVDNLHRLASLGVKALLGIGVGLARKHRSLRSTLPGLVDRFPNLFGAVHESFGGLAFRISLWHVWIVCDLCRVDPTETAYVSVRLEFRFDNLILFRRCIFGASCGGSWRCNPFLWLCSLDKSADGECKIPNCGIIVPTEW